MGIGIPEDMMNKLFSLEGQFSQKGTRDEKGSGLGLILCRDFINRHGGQISAESKRGKGSRFVFSIPLKKQGS